MDKDIDYIVAVAECRSISKAAEILFISQPSLSRYISKLETELGLRLFVRSSDGVSLTKAGEVYVEYAKEIKRLQSTMSRKLHQMRMETPNQISICMTLNSGSLSTWRVTEEFYKKYPDCRLEFFNVMSKDIPGIMEERKCDFAVGPDLCDHGTYSYMELTREYFVLAVPLRYNLDSLAEKRAGRVFPWIDMAKLPEMDWVLQEPSCNVRRGIDALFQLGNQVIKPKMELTNSILTIQAAERQLGCCLLSEVFMPYIAHKEFLRYYYVGDESVFSPSGVIYEKDKIFTPQEKFCIAKIKRMLIDSKKEILEEFSGIQYKE